MKSLDIEHIAEAFCKFKDLTHSELIKVLVTEGTPSVEAELAVALFPIAFGRLLLEEIGVRGTDRAIVTSENTLRSGVSFTRHPIYVAAREYGQRAWNESLLTRDEYLRIALRSWEMAAVDQMMHGGIPCEEVCLTDGALFLSDIAAKELLASSSEHF